MDNQLNLFEQPKQGKPEGEFVHVDRLVMPVKYLAEKHTGVTVSCSGLLERIADGCKVRPDQRFLLGEMYKHLQETAARFYSGDIKVVDEFLQLYCLDEERPK